ncbi:MAG: DNA ligase [Candidatus Woykebacteria bacterium RBG_16_39_9b]|uniref:Probable DNA ligase n=1 Tax=Candidatus Woykebacteria bacterium RBG_16_39_9b TaxID=1802595 RepID=A0A1G1WDY7_9BACT|nr:MAG: DNA ligase [Candidatus Woykebacteria bacterium RBG_16_39_9b]
MKFSDLTIYFEELEATSSRIELTNILSDLLKKLSPEEIDKVAYLLQGRVVPFYEPIEIGMADKMVDQAIASACNVSRENVQKLSAKLGDMGLVVEQLSGGKKGSKLTISDVHEGLYKIANTSGEGSVGKKINVLAGLLKELDAKSAKHLVKITLSKLRLGIGDPTVLDALSVAKEGDKSARPVLEEAYNKTSDLGFVAKKYWSAASAQDALKAVKKVELQVGKPVRPALAERLPDAESVVKRMGEEFAVEPKYDGFRNQVHLDRRQKADSGKQVQIFSRNLENMTHMFPDLVEAVKKEVNAKSTIFEGEAIAFNPVTEEFLPFQETTKRRRKYSVEEFAAKLPLKLFAFDLLYLNGNDITNLSYKERRKKLSQIISSEGQIMVAKEEILHSSQELTKMFEEQIASGLEGVMIKKLDAPYKAGNRGFHWVKFKRMAAGELSDTIDCVLLGIYTGTGKRTGFGVGGLLVGVYNQEKDEFVTVSRIGTGLTDDEFRKVNQIAQKIKVDKKPARVSSLINPSYWVEPKEVLEIFADEITRSPVHTAGKIGDEPGYALRFPRLVSFRGADKRAEDATTVSELINMYKRQRKVKV